MDTDDTQEIQPEQTDELVEVTETPTEDKDWRAEALKYKAMAHKYKQRATETKAPEAVARPQESIDEKIWEVADMIRQGYTKADAEFIQRNGGKKALEDANSYVAVAMRTVHEQRRAEEASSAVNSTQGQTEVERKYTPEQLKNMSVAELEKLLPHADPY